LKYLGAQSERYHPVTPGIAGIRDAEHHALAQQKAPERAGLIREVVDRTAIDQLPVRYQVLQDPAFNEHERRRFAVFHADQGSAAEACMFVEQAAFVCREKRRFRQSVRIFRHRAAALRRTERGRKYDLAIAVAAKSNPFGRAPRPGNREIVV
jgi:hypothetical protein